MEQVSCTMLSCTAKTASLVVRDAHSSVVQTASHICSYFVVVV